MVHVYNCHPFASQQIVPTEQEPGLVCCGGGALFVVIAGGCKIEAYQMQEEGCPLICRFATMGTVHSILHSQIGDYLVTIEEKNQATYLRAYTNWRYQAAEKTRVGVRLLGHLLRASSFRGAPKEQMEIIEIPLVEPPLCIACCPLSGDLLVGCARSLVVFSLRSQALNDRLSVLDFERVLILHMPGGMSPSQVALCRSYLALQVDLEVLVVRLESLEGGQKGGRGGEEHITTPGSDLDCDGDIRREGFPINQESEDFFLFPKHQELLGEGARECGISVTLEWTGMENEARTDMGVTYVLFRRFAPDFYQGCSVEETRLHSLQLLPVFTSNQEVAGDPKGSEPACVFCFFSLPSMGYMYSLRNTVELVSTYQYPEKAQQAVLSERLLYVITRNALQCFSVRCSAVAARVEDPYIDTTMKACPPSSMEVCALRIQLFIGLKAVCLDRRHLVLLTAADVDGKEEPERAPPRRTLESKDHKMLSGILQAVGLEPTSNPVLENLLSRALPYRKTYVSKPKEPSDSAHGWNLYVISTASTLQLYREIVEYSKRYELTNPLSQSCLHLLSEAHLLLRASLLDPQLRLRLPADRQHLQEAFQDSCAQLGDCFSRMERRDSHLALPYYRMSGLSITEVIQRNVTASGPSCNYGKGFLFFLKHSLYEEDAEELSEETADAVLGIFSVAEPAQLPHVVSSPFMRNASPPCAMATLANLEVAGTHSATLSLCQAALALRMGDLHLYQQQMGRHAEMLLVYGFIEEPRLLLQGRGKALVPTPLARHLRDTQPGLLVAAAVALHENSKVKLDEADLFLQELCKDTMLDTQVSPQLLVDFWEGLLVATSQEAVLQELLFRLSSVYVDRLTHPEHSAGWALRTAEDLINSCAHYGTLFPWVTILTPPHLSKTPEQQEDLHKLQSLLCGPSLDVSSIMPLLEQLADTDGAGLSVHVLCATRLGHHEASIRRLLDRCPHAIIPYANHELQNDKLALWWQRLFPELCERSRALGGPDDVLLAALKETLVVVAMELSPLEFLDLLPDDGTAHFFLPHLLECSQRNLMT